MDVLREKHAELADLFEEYEAQTRILQRQAVQEIVPDAELQQELSMEDLEWVEDYLQDLGSLFRIFRRQKFIASFTHEALRDAILWRLAVLKPAVSYDRLFDHSPSSSARVLQQPPGLSALSFLPFDCLDTLGRPVAVLRVADVDFYADQEKLRREIILSLERMRVALQRLNENNSGDEVPVLQYALVVDVEGVSVKTLPVDLVKWYMREIQPWYHGIIGSAFVMNYNWAHSGLWTVLRHILPASAIAKVVFLSQEELSQFVSESCLQSISSTLQNARQPKQNDNAPSSSVNLAGDLNSPPAITPSASSESALSDDSSRVQSAKRTQKTRSSRFSIDNPFYGYPTDTSSFPPSLQETAPPISPLSSESSPIDGRRHRAPSYPISLSRSNVPTLRHGRRRKRDLARALLVLYWQRWHTQLGLGILVLLLFGLLKAEKMRWMRVPLLSTTLGRVHEWVRAFR